MTSQRTKHKQRRRKTTALLLILSFLIAVIPAIPFAAEKADTKEITIVREETDRRTASEKHFLCSDGSMMAVGYSGDVHYMDETGKYQTIDNTLSYSAAKGQYRTVGNPNFTVSFGASADQPGVIVTNKEGNALSAITTVLLNPQSAAARRALVAEPATLSLRNEAKVQVKGLSKDAPEVLSVPELHSELVYENAHGSGITSEYALDGNTLKENVIFDYPVSYTAIETQYTMEGLFVEVTESGALILYGADNEAVYVVEAPYMYDASGAECPAVSVSVTRSGDTWTVRYVPDESWRTSSERVYPVVFDPFIREQTYGNIGDMYSMSTNGYFNGTTSGTQLKAGIECYSTSVSNGLQYVYRTFIKPNAYPVIPEGNTIVQFMLTFKKSSVTGSGNLQLVPIRGNANFSGNDYTLGSWIGATSYNSTAPREEYSFGLPATEYNNCGDGYVIMETSESPRTNGSHYITFYSSRASTTANHPKIVVSYVPTGIDNKVTTLYNFATQQYLSVSLNSTVGMTAAAASASLWKFQRVGLGDYRIVSCFYPNKCLEADSSGNLTLQDIDSNKQNQIWYIGADGPKYCITNAQYPYGLYSQNGSGGTAVCRIDTNRVASLEERYWQMLDLAPKYSTTLYSAATSTYLTASSESTVTMTENSTEKSLWKYVLTSNGRYQIQSQYYFGKCLVADANGTLSLESADADNQNQLWYVTVENGILSFTNVQQEANLYSLMDDEDTVQFGVDVNGSVASENEQWMLTDLVPGIEEYAVTLYHPQTGRYLTTESNFTLSMEEFSEISSLWNFVLTNDGSCQIVSQYYPDKCLASDENGNVTLVTPATSFTDSNQNQLWYVSVNGEVYNIVNQEYKTVLYLDTDTEGNVTCQAGSPTDSKAKQWNLLETVLGIQETGKMLYNAQTDRYLTATSETTVAMTATATIELLWTYTLTDNGSYQIIPLNYPEKCLASDASGNLSLAWLDADSQNQRWYICVENEKHTITNVQYDVDLYSQIASDETVTCGIDMSDSRTAEEKRWARLDYVCAIKNVDINRSLKNYDGKNYDGEYIRLGTYEYNPLYDKYGFRMVYHVQYAAYMIMPISSSNGYYRALTITKSPDDPSAYISSLYSVSESRLQWQLFTVELQSSGKYAIRLKEDPDLYLTGYRDNYCARLYEEATDLENQIWEFSVYEYTLPSGTKDAYAEVEHYYRALGFGNPFGANPDRTLAMTSDFGPRNLSSSPLHEGLDLRTKLDDDASNTNRDLYSPYSGMVVEVNKTNIYAAAGLYIKIDTGIPAYSGSEYTICIVYMHMKEDSIIVSVNDKVETTTLLGQSGDTGGKNGHMEPHLHYGVFLHKTGEAYSPTSNPLNPLWFLTPEEYDN